MSIRANSPEQLPKLVDDWESKPLIIKLKTGEVYNGKYHETDSDDKQGLNWYVPATPAGIVSADAVEWWIESDTLAAQVEPPPAKGAGQWRESI